MATNTNTNAHDLNFEENVIDEESSPIHHSPESAGIVRGVSKSSKAISKLRRPQIKIKPKARATPSPPAVTTTTIATKTGKNIRLKNVGGRLKNGSKSYINKTNSSNLKNNVAKISDRASKGVDIASSFDETLIADSNNKESATNTKKIVFQKKVFPKVAIVNFVSNLLQNTILGAFVFTAYEECIELFNTSNTAIHENDTTVSTIDDAFANVSISKHFLSGGIAGSFYGFLTTSIESIKIYPITTIKIPSTLSFISSIFHHCTSHAVLFGSYESFKRLSLFCLTEKTYLDFSYQEEENMHNDENSNGGHYDSLRSSSLLPSLSMKQLLCISIAGGLSGSMQHIISHYTENLIASADNHLKVSYSTLSSNNGDGAKTRNNHYLKEKNSGVKGPTSYSTPKKQPLVHYQIKEHLSRSKNLYHSLSRIKLPPMRPILFIFPINAIGFIAFEYGRDIVSSSRE